MNPQTPKWKEFLHKLLVGGLGYVPGVCSKILRNMKQLQHLPASSGTHPHCTGSWRMKAAVEGACITHFYGPVIRCNMSNWIVSVGNSGITLVLTFQKKTGCPHDFPPKKNCLTKTMSNVPIFSRASILLCSPFPIILMGMSFLTQPMYPEKKSLNGLFSLLNYVIPKSLSRLAIGQVSFVLLFKNDTNKQQKEIALEADQPRCLISYGLGVWDGQFSHMLFPSLKKEVHDLPDINDVSKKNLLHIYIWYIYIYVV